jgi:SagB-type dehydrogenase family enzyme
MSERSMSASLSGQQFGGHDELLERLPVRPRLLSELIIVPDGPQAVTFYGTQQPRTLRCPQGLRKLSELLALLDGYHTLDKISERLESGLSGGVTGLVSLLFRNGLLEDGHIEGLGDHPVACFAARFFGTTGHHAHRAGALAQAAEVRLLVACSQELTGTVRASLGDGVLGEVRIASADTDVADARHTHALVIFSGGLEDEGLLAIADAMYASGRPYFVGTTGADCLQFGPLVLPGLSASHRCAREQLDAPVPLTDLLEAEFQCAYIVHEWLQIALGLLTETYLNKVRIHPVDARGAYPVSRHIARIPGTVSGGLPTTQKLSVNDPAFSSWVHHVSVRMPPLELFAPRLFEGHFKVANLELYGSPITRSYALGTLALPAAAALPDPLSVPTDMPHHPRELSLETLSAILQYAVGEQQHDDGSRSRIAPSGGSLRSCSFYLLVNDLLGLQPGLYLYDGEDGVLIPVRVASLSTLRHVLYGTDEPLYPVSLFATSHLGRVRTKYLDFGYNLVHLDAGIACEYAALVASVFDIRVEQPSLLATERCAELLKLSRQGNAQIVSAVLHVGTRLLPTPRRPLHANASTADSLACGSGEFCLPPVERSSAALSVATSRAIPGEKAGVNLAHLLLNRHATYLYADHAIETSRLAALIAFAHLALAAQHERGLPRLALWPVLVLLRPDESMAAGIYDCRRPDPAQWVQRSSTLTAEMFGECFNQRSFQKAGAALVFMADLEQSFGMMGQSAYRMLLQQAGGVVAATWLEANAAGLVGCSVGGMIEAGFVRFAGTDGYRETPIFSLILAHPAQEQARAPGEDDDESGA